MTHQEQFVLSLAQYGVTPNYLRKRGVCSPSKVISNLRRQGACIYTNQTSNGTVYRVGKPSKAMIAMSFATAGPRQFM